MDDAQLWRRLLINNLYDTMLRFRIFAAYFPGALGTRLKVMSEARVLLVASVLSAFPDDEWAAARDLGEEETDVFQQEADVARDEGEPYAIELLCTEERELVQFVRDLQGEALPDALWREIAEALDRNIVQLTQPAADVPGHEATARSIGRSPGQLQRSGSRQRVYEVWFGTNRAPKLKGGKVVGFSSDWSASTTYGKCGVVIPRTHKIGENKPSWWRRTVLGERPLTLESMVPLAASAFWTDIRAQLTQNGATADDAIVFLHGYNVSFEHAAVYAAQIGADLNLPGAFAFFSWPSQGRLFGYLADEASIEASEDQITEFLQSFAVRSGAQRVHLIAHSMGNRGLLRAVNRIAEAIPERVFGQLILAAPDVDSRTFAKLHAACPRVGRRTTLYVSSKDWAVRSSRFVHAADRIGIAPPFVTADGIDTVCVSKVDLSLLGHGYVASCRAVLTDIHELFVSELQPDQRTGMTTGTGDKAGYWELAG